jgi:hypothetical protein
MKNFMRKAKIFFKNKRFICSMISVVILAVALCLISLFYPDYGWIKY